MALLQYQSQGGFQPQPAKQFAADDRSYQAEAQRTLKPTGRTVWWYDQSGNRQSKVLSGELAATTGHTVRNGKLILSGPFGTREFNGDGSSISSAGASATEAPPKFSLIPKDPEIDKAASAGLASAQAKSAQADTLFAKHLANFNQRLSPDLIDAEIGTYKNAASGLKSLLDTERSNIKAAQDATTAQRLLEIYGAMDREELGGNARAGANLGASGEKLRIFGDAVARELIPARERLAMLGRGDALEVYNATLANASRPREVNQSYLQLLGQQPGQLLSLGGQEGDNLANAARLLDSNRFSWSPDPRLTGQLPTPVAGYGVPGIPNYGGVTTPVRQPSLMPYVGPQGGGGGGDGYVPPGTRQQIGGGSYYSAPPYVAQYTYNPNGTREQVYPPDIQGRVDKERAARSFADYQYELQTGVTPAQDRNYNDEVWRSFYNEALRMGA